MAKQSGDLSCTKQAGVDLDVAVRDDHVGQEGPPVRLDAGLCRSSVLELGGHPHRHVEAGKRMDEPRQGFSKLFPLGRQARDESEGGASERRPQSDFATFDNNGLLTTRARRIPAAPSGSPS